VNGIKCFTMHEVDKFGIGRVVDEALDHANPNRDRPTHLSFDVDALDPTVAPSEQSCKQVQANHRCGFRYRHTSQRRSYISGR